MAIDGLLLQQAGQGDSYLLPTVNTDRYAAMVANQQAAKLAKEKMAAKAKEERDKKLEEQMKWDPEYAWLPHTKMQDQKINSVLDYRTHLLKESQSRDLTPDEINKYEQLKNDAAVTARKSQDLKAMYPQLQSQIKEMDNPYYDSGSMMSDLNTEIFDQPDPSKVNFEKIQGILTDPKYFKANKWAEDFAKSMPEQVVSRIGQMQVDGGSVLTDKEIKSKFFDLDANGNPQKDANGNPIIKITDDTVNLALQNPEFNRYVQAQVQQNPDIPPAQIVKNLLSPYAKQEVKTNASKLWSDKEKKAGSEDDTKMISTFNVEKNFNMGSNAKDPNNPVKSGWAPQEIRLEGKKMDKPIRVNSKTFYDPETSKAIQNIGDKPVMITRLLLRPVNKTNNKFVIGKKDEVVNDPNVEYKWFAEGNYKALNDEGKEIEKKVLVPYDDTKTDLEAAYGVNLENRDISEYSDFELTSLIKNNYPDATPQERLEIFKKIKGQ